MTSLLAPDATRSVLTMTRSREPHPVLVVALYGELDLSMTHSRELAAAVCVVRDVDVD